MKSKINYWIDRVNNILMLQIELHLPTVNMTLNEQELRDLLDILGALLKIVEKGEAE